MPQVLLERVLLRVEHHRRQVGQALGQGPAVKLRVAVVQVRQHDHIRVGRVGAVAERAQVPHVGEKAGDGVAAERHALRLWHVRVVVRHRDGDGDFGEAVLLREAPGREQDCLGVPVRRGAEQRETRAGRAEAPVNGKGGFTVSDVGHRFALS
ncbi:MAG: hypothetical protein M5R40_00245 [Anaerolineae bacterium]|nr:hypothetical protein [Anaerolineae bacterium]